jgi:hypothetical protein
MSDHTTIAASTTVKTAGPHAAIEAIQIAARTATPMVRTEARTASVRSLMWSAYGDPPTPATVSRAEFRARHLDRAVNQLYRWE